MKNQHHYPLEKLKKFYHHLDELGLLPNIAPKRATLYFCLMIIISIIQLGIICYQYIVIYLLENYINDTDEMIKELANRFIEST